MQNALVMLDISALMIVISPHTFRIKNYFRNLTMVEDMLKLTQIKSLNTWPVKACTLWEKIQMAVELHGR